MPIFVRRDILHDFRARLPPLLAKSAVAVNQDFAEDAPRVLSPQDEVAIIPPVSGG